MKYIIDEDICKKYNVTIEEFILLLLFVKCQPKGISSIDLINSIVSKKLANRDTIKQNNLVISDRTKDLVAAILIESEPKAQLKDEELTELAKELQQTFPKGKKPGTTYQWRGNVIEITRKLKTLVGKYNVELDREKVLNAARQYVQSFNGNYEKMRLLKYFILKAVKDADGNIVLYSDLMSLLENEDSTQLDNDWTSREI